MNLTVDLYDLNDDELKDKYKLYKSLQSRNWRDDVIQELIELELIMRGVKYD